MLDGTFELDRANVQELREHFIAKGIKPYADGLIQAEIPGRLGLQISGSMWLRIMIDPRILPGYRFEVLLQQMGLDLKSVLRIHDELKLPDKSEKCPKCGTEYLNGEEVAGFHSAWRNSWRNDGPPDDPFNIPSGHDSGSSDDDSPVVL